MRASVVHRVSSLTLPRDMATPQALSDLAAAAAASPIKEFGDIPCLRLPKIIRSAVVAEWLKVNRFRVYKRKLQQMRAKLHYISDAETRKYKRALERAKTQRGVETAFNGMLEKSIDLYFEIYGVFDEMSDYHHKDLSNVKLCISCIKLLLKNRTGSLKPHVKLANALDDSACHKCGLPLLYSPWERRDAMSYLTELSIPKPLSEHEIVELE